MVLVVSRGARALWAEHRQDEDELQRVFAGQKHVTRQEVEQELRNRGVLQAQRKVAKGGARARPQQSKPGAELGVSSASTTPHQPVTVTLGASVGEPVAGDQPNQPADPLFLDGNTIEVTWKRGRVLRGKVQLAASSRRRATKYRIFFEGRKPEGAAASWSVGKGRIHIPCGSVGGFDL
tara:strand:+ start:375 stop:911 length:537 start_codon:yes stop_codon:yes gene_type:complete